MKKQVSFELEPDCKESSIKQKGQLEYAKGPRSQKAKNLGVYDNF